MPPIETNEYEGFDTAAVAAEIGESLFSKAEVAPGAEIPGFVEAQAKVETPGVEAKPVAEFPAKPDAVVPPAELAPGVVVGENSVAKPLPKSWKKEMAPEWEKLSPATKEYVHEREAQVMRGINQYQQGYQAWDNLTKPFAEVLSANPDVNPIILMQGLMATHLRLLDPSVSAPDKSALVSNLLAQYGITLGATGEQAQQAPQADPALLRRLQTAEQKLANWEKSQREQGINTFKAQVDEFAAKPENEHFEEVGADILRFIQSGAAATLQSAYDLACWANPAVRAKMIAKQQSAIIPAAQPARKANGQFRNIEGDTTIVAKPKVGTMDDTINAVVAKAYAKH